MIFPSSAPRTLLRCFLLAVAIACLGTYAYAYLERVLYQAHESRAFDQAQGRAAAVVASTPKSRRAAAPCARRFQPPSSDGFRSQDCICPPWCVKASAGIPYNSPSATFRPRRCPDRPETSAWPVTATPSFAS